ncbi:helix-turn-helix domain-containing protein [Arenibacter algicola]|jgi:AraC-like DNA-binding protein|uniref:Bifunctional transcriptional activator/DNA repair enzyme AdaA n=1 Tax=Arenibacter algicola TaxID=616991 RepID=A0A221US69_9FLAO|nr:AraC family transcriptional regulator [Arenibacter algicola]ASO04175.1 bifunctional transcriptional activator/DNA repair enzyme AdaA [Arenibacter algicola]|tara:strand:- start:1928 stop:2797 length:870 start_codon:yes stop_codon:yes gene_type:complete
MSKILQSLKLALLNVGYAKLGPLWDYDDVISPFIRLYYITEGSAMVYHSNEAIELKPGHIYIIPSYTFGRYKCDEYHEQYYISCLEEIKNGYSIFNFSSFIFESKANPMDLYYFKRLLELNPNRQLENNNPKVYDNRPTLMDFEKRNEELSPSAYMETHAILEILISRFIKDMNTQSTKSNVKKEFGMVLNYIHENLHENLTVKQLADFCHLNTDYFSRVFNESFGMRPNKYIQSKRIERAQLLLLSTNNSLKQIAEKVGLENLSYFNRIFKGHTGVTPGIFREERLQK